MAAFGLRSLGQHQGGVIAAAVIHQQDFMKLPSVAGGGGAAGSQFGQAPARYKRGSPQKLLYRRRTEHINVLQADGAR